MKKILGLLMIAVLTTLVFPQGQNNNINRWSGTSKVTVSGLVVKVNHPLAELKAADGKVYEMRLGPIWFWKNKNYELKSGEKAEVYGALKEDNGKLYLFPYKITQAKNTIILSGDDGLPLWSKGGKGSGKRGLRN